APVRAQVPYDPPTISVVDVGYYRITLLVQAGPSGAPNGFGVDWMTKSDYEAYGWPTDEGGNGYNQYCDFTGAPTLNTAGGDHFQLGPNESVQIQLGDLFDETGMYATYTNGLPAGTDYVIRVHAEGDDVRPESDFSSNVNVGTARAECTQGFWQNHPEVWPM